jgi:hypothetical protein
MKEFVQKIILFTVPLIILFFLFEAKISTHPTTFKYKKENLESQLQTIELLILGNSQAFGGINPDFFSVNGFNLCNNSQTLYYDSEITLEYYHKIRNLRYILINISHFSFWHIMQDSHEPWRAKFYYKFWDIEPQASSVSILNKYSNLSLLKPMVAIKRIFNKDVIDFYKVYHKNGWAFNDTVRTYEINEQESKDRIELFRKFYLHEERIVLNVKIVDNLLNSLIKNGVIPIFISTPLPKVYYSMIEPDVVEINKQILNDFSKKYDCKYFDYTTDNRFVKEDFIDVNHLNFIGAEKFSRIIQKEVLLQFEQKMNCKQEN